MTHQPLRKIHIAEAKAIADRVGADAVVVLAFKGDEIAGASYGRTKAICASTGKWMDYLIEKIPYTFLAPSDFES